MFPVGAEFFHACQQTMHMTKLIVFFVVLRRRLMSRSRPEQFQQKMKKFGTRLCTSPIIKLTYVRGGADKSLARPGRKQATATKLGTYSIYSPRSSIYFSGHCSNFCKLPKKFRILSVQPGLCGDNDLHAGRKTATIQLLFQSREQVVVRLGQIRKMRWVIQTLAIQVGQFLLRCKCSVRQYTVVQEQDSLGELPAAFFLQNAFNCTTRDE